MSTISPLDIDRNVITSLRLESAALPVPERRALHVAQAHQRRIDKVVALHTCADLFEECRECGHLFPCPTLVALGVEES